MSSLKPSTPANAAQSAAMRALLLVLVLALTSCGTTRTVVITSEPPNAVVLLDNVELGRTPLEAAITWSEKDSSSQHVQALTIQGRDCAEWSQDLTFAMAAEQTGIWRIHAELDRLVHTLDILLDTEPPGATVRLDSGSVFGTPARVPITFHRETPDHPWSMPRATITLGEEFASRYLELDYENVSRNPHVLVSLPRIRQRVPVDITCNVDGALITVNGREIGTAPLKHVFTFARKDADDRWNSFIVSAHKEHHRYRRPGGVEAPYEVDQFSTSVRLHDLAEGTLHIELEPIQFYRTPVYRYTMSEEGLATEMHVEGSQISDIEKEPAVYSVTNVPCPWVGGAFTETRISVMPNGETIVYSFPVHTSSQQEAMANLCMQQSHEVTRLTDGYQLDLEATVSPDGRWIYFASNRLRNGKLNLWRIQTAGRGGLTKITDSASSIADTEPSVSPDGQRIAYTSYLEGADSPQIWLANADGSLPTQLRIGRHPSWSPDGRRIAYVAPDVTGSEQIWVMGTDGSSPTQLTSGRYNHQYPAWTPDGNRIVYACNQAANDAGVQQFDIWIMNSDGSRKTQLTVNGSYDNRPAVSPDGRFVYFVSNRGAQREFDEGALQIWRLQLEPE